MGVGGRRRRQGGAPKRPLWVADRTRSERFVDIVQHADQYHEGGGGDLERVLLPHAVGEEVGGVPNPEELHHTHEDARAPRNRPRRTSGSEEVADVPKQQREDDGCEEGCAFVPSGRLSSWLRRASSWPSPAAPCCSCWRGFPPSLTGDPRHDCTCLCASRTHGTSFGVGREQLRVLDGSQY